MYDIIYFGNDWHAENKTSSHHISEQLAKNNRILYVECPGLRAPKSSGRDIKKLFSKVLKCLSKPQKIEENFHVYTLFQIPFHRFAFIRWLNRVLIVFAVKRLAKSFGFHNPLLWFVVPHVFMIPDKVANRAAIYYCIDDYAALPDIDVDSVAAMDRQMSESADIIFVASATLLEKKQRLNSNVHVSPHGVDFDHFNRVYTEKTLGVPDDVKDLAAEKVIGFFGLIEEWIDLELIKHIAEHNSDWHILMIGRVAVAENVCAGLPNVHFIGRRPFSQLPDYTTVFDVGILPYKLNTQVLNSNPIKLREYLAASKPVVSVRFPQVESYSEVVEIANTYTEFVDCVEYCLENDSPEKQLARVESVRDVTWEARVGKVMEIVDDHCSKD